MCSESLTDGQDEAWRQTQAEDMHHFRSQMGLTQKEFAALMGWSTSMQSQVEQNAPSIRIRPMYTMAARFAAERPRDALQVAQAISDDLRRKVLLYARRLEKFGTSQGG